MTITRALLPLLASSTPVEHTLAVQGRYLRLEQHGQRTWPLTLPAPTAWSVTFDETTRPYGKATLTYPERAYDWEKVDPTNHLTMTRLRLSAGYTWPSLARAETDQLAVLVVNEIRTDHAAGTTTLDLVSDEALIEGEPCPPGTAFDVPDDLADLADIWTALLAAAPPTHPIHVVSRAQIADENLPGVRAMVFQTGNTYADWLWSLAETAGLWLHSNQEPNSHGGLIAKARAEATSYGVNLSKNSPTPITTRTTHTLTPHDAAHAVDLTVTWTGSDGTEKHSTRRYTNNAATIRRVTTRSVRQRPPIIAPGQRGLPADWPPATDLLNRLEKRTWTLTCEARNLYWLRPRTPIKTDHGPALISSITFDGPTGLMTLNARPY